jgi:hypothetical protein
MDAYTFMFIIRAFIRIQHAFCMHLDISAIYYMYI